MTDTKKWVAAAVLAALVLLAGGWTLLVGPERSEAAELREQVAAQESTTSQLETQLQVLRDKAASLPEQEAALADFGRLLPTKAELPQLVRALTEASRSAGVELVSVAPGALTPVGSTDPAAAAAPAPGTNADPAAPATAPGTPAAGGLSALPLTLDATGGFYELEQFVAELEDLPRALRVTGLTLAAGSGASEQGVSSASRDLSLKLTAEVYVSAAAAAASPAAAQPLPAPGGTASTGAAATTPTTES